MATSNRDQSFIYTNKTQQQSRSKCVGLLKDVRISEKTTLETGLVNPVESQERYVAVNERHKEEVKREEVD